MLPRGGDLIPGLQKFPALLPYSVAEMHGWEELTIDGALTDAGSNVKRISWLPDRPLDWLLLTARAPDCGPAVAASEFNRVLKAEDTCYSTLNAAAAHKIFQIVRAKTRPRSPTSPDPFINAISGVDASGVETGLNAVVLEFHYSTNPQSLARSS
jgi:hypothetical protein